MVQQLLAIVRNTFVESIRQPIFVVLLLMGAAMLVMNMSLSGFTMSDDNKILVDMGLSTLFIMGLALAAFTATGVLSAEVENRTVLTVVSKPVPRSLFVLGKYLGVAAALGLAFWTLMQVFLLTVRHQVLQRASDEVDRPVIVLGLLAATVALAGSTLANYFYRWVFTSTFTFAFFIASTLAFLLVLMINKQWHFQSIMTDLDPQLVITLLLVFEAVLILTAVAIACSTRLGQVMTLVICVLVFLLGLIGHYFSTQADKTIGNVADSLVHRILYGLVKAFFFLVPNFQYLWQADALTQGHPINGGHVLVLSLYSLLYIGAVLCLAVALFQTREVG